jgi:rhamnulokinase
LFDVDQPDLLLPGDMPARINAQLKSAGSTPIADGPEGRTNGEPDLSQLADRYAAVLQNASKHHGESSQAALCCRRRKQKRC